MRSSVERLRIGLLVGAGLLVVVIASFLGYAHYRVRRAVNNLPGRLGATITRESNGYTYSQSDGKKTVFTIHAAKAVEHTDGKFTLHDVNMVMYGHKGDRADRISGSEFEYDTKQEIIRAMGTVHIDLQAPSADDPASAAKAEDRVVHVTTSGLVYTKKLATAATDEGIDFSFGGFTGHAVGAEYNSDSGHLVLESAVTMSGLDRRKEGGRPIALKASHGELDREKNQADFNDARYSSAGDVAQADLAHLYLRKDGTVEHIEGLRNVVLEDAGQGKANCDRLEIALDATNKPMNAVLSGDVHFKDDEPLRQARGDSASANLEFDDHGRVTHAVLHGGVHTQERVQVQGAEGAQEPSERTLTADELELLFAGAEKDAKLLLEEARATGSARMSSVATISSGVTGKTPGATTNNLSADSLDAHFTAPHGAAELSTAHGVGHTVFEQMAPGGVHQASAGERLDASFREVGGRRSNGEQRPVEIATAVQQGHVMIDRSLPVVSGGGPEIQHATAGKAAYDAESNRLTLTEDVQMSDAEKAISAARVVLEQGSGDATADGAVKVTYLQTGAAEPVHVLAARAELNHDAARATFYGSAGGSAGGSAVGTAAGGRISAGAQGSGLARMWQAGALQANGSQAGGSQIEAPVLVFEQEAKRLTARAEKPGVLGQVHAVLTSAASANRAPAPSATATKKEAKTEAKAGKAPQSPVRITSSVLVYSDERRQAEFTGGVRVVDSDGEMRAQQATVFLTAASTPSEKTSKTQAKQTQGVKQSSGAGAAGLLGGNVERIVATQNVEVIQPGRRATGDRLVYTASDQMFVLTGTPAVPPKVVDAVQGSTTGSALRFHSGDDSVSVMGDSEGSARKVHTETRVKQ